MSKKEEEDEEDLDRLLWKEQERLELASTLAVDPRRVLAGYALLAAGSATLLWRYRALLFSSARSGASAAFSARSVATGLISAGIVALLPTVLVAPPPITEIAPTHKRLEATSKDDSFEFEVLNKRWEDEVSNMEETVGLDSAPFWFPEKIRKPFKEIQEEERKKKRRELVEKEKKLEKDILIHLESGASPKEVLQKLSKCVFVLDFADYENVKSADDIGDTDWTKREPDGTLEWVAFLRDAVSFLIQAASPFDEVVLRLSSPGGSVTDYGLAASQILRLRKASIKVTISVDTIAASGAYLMASVADCIVAAPFAMIGSIGVVAELPNINRLLKNRLDVDYLLFTAGAYKRTVHPFAEITDEGRRKFIEELEEIHSVFKDHVASHRPALNIEEVSTGEAWLASEALKKGLIDDLITSEELLRQKEKEEFNIISMSLRKNKPRRVISSLMWELLDLDAVGARYFNFMKTHWKRAQMPQLLAYLNPKHLMAKL